MFHYDKDENSFISYSDEQPEEPLHFFSTNYFGWSDQYPPYIDEPQGPKWTTSNGYLLWAKDSWTAFALSGFFEEPGQGDSWINEWEQNQDWDWYFD